MSRLVMLPIARQVPVFRLLSSPPSDHVCRSPLRRVRTPGYSAVKSSRSRLSGSSWGINSGVRPVAPKQRSRHGSGQPVRERAAGWYLGHALRRATRGEDCGQLRLVSLRRLNA
jgi:hypothetical protein